MIMPDQTALHKLGKRRLYLPRRFNEQRGLREDTVVKHFLPRHPLAALFPYLQHQAVGAGGGAQKAEDTLL